MGEGRMGGEEDGGGRGERTNKGVGGRHTGDLLLSQHVHLVLCASSQCGPSPG